MSHDYTILEYMKRRWKQVDRKLRFSAGDTKEYFEWKARTRARLKELIGYNTMIPADPEPRILPPEDKGDYIQHHVVIQTEPDIRMPMYVLEPKKAEKPYKPIIAPHGHGGGGKAAVAGVVSSAEIGEAVKQYNYDYGRQLCKAGFMVFCPDARGFGERKEPTAVQDILSGSCAQLNAMAFPLGQTVTGMWVWDLHRLIDYIESRDDCDSGKLCCTGLSGGGLQTLWATALDDRIHAAVISGYFYGYEQSLLELHNNCWCNYIPRLYEYVDIGEIGALIAPRPLFIETGDKDTLNGREEVDNVKRPLETVKKAYRLFDKTANVRHSVCHGEHQWYGEGVAEWLKEQTRS